MRWSYSYTPDLWPAFITFALVIFLGQYSWCRRDIPAAKPFSIACLLGGFWTLGVILELSAVNFSTKVFWVKYQAIWQLPVVTAVTCFVIHYAGLGRWLDRRNIVLLAILPLFSVLLIVTNDIHHLVWAGFQMNGHVTGVPGRLFWLFTSYIYLLGIINFVVLLRLAIHSPGHRRSVSIILAGQIAGRIVYTMDKHNIGSIGPGESILLSVGMVAAAYAIAFLRFHAIDPVAAARSAVRQQMHEGLFVIDLQGRIVDVNPMAAEICRLPEKSLRNMPLEEVMPLDAAGLGKMEDTGIGQTDITLDKDDLARQYTLSRMALRGRHGEVIGQLLLLHDVTEQKRAQARRLEQQRVIAVLKEREHLARELHDGIGQVLGYVSIQAQTAIKWMNDGNKAKVEPLLQRLVEVSKEAHADVRESIYSLKAISDREWSFIPTLKKYIERLQENYGMKTELLLCPGVEENAFDSGAGIQLLRVIQEAFTNARKHGGANSFRVYIERNGSKSQITVIDDGHGFDISRIEGCDGGHFGLSFMQERMQQIGGTLKIESTPGGGTALTLNVPIEKS